jgi:hypothetical protein
MATEQIVADLRRFILSYAEHDPECPGINARAWEEHRKVCTCGFAMRLDELLDALDQRLVQGTTRTSDA